MRFLHVPALLSTNERPEFSQNTSLGILFPAQESTLRVPNQKLYLDRLDHLNLGLS